MNKLLEKIGSKLTEENKSIIQLLERTNENELYSAYDIKYILEKHNLDKGHVSFAFNFKQKSYYLSNQNIFFIEIVKHPYLYYFSRGFYIKDLISYRIPIQLSPYRIEVVVYKNGVLNINYPDKQYTIVYPTGENKDRINKEDKIKNDILLDILSQEKTVNEVLENAILLYDYQYSENDTVTFNEIDIIIKKLYKII